MLYRIEQSCYGIIYGSAKILIMEVCDMKTWYMFFFFFWIISKKLYLERRHTVRAILDDKESQQVILAAENLYYKTLRLF